jgi:hypothetical protein
VGKSILKQELRGIIRIQNRGVIISAVSLGLHYE